MARKTTKAKRKTTAAPHIPTSDTELGDSWVVNDDPNAQNYHDEDGDFTASDSELEYHQALPTTRRRTKAATNVQTGTTESVIIPSRSSRSEPEFRMPKLEQSGEIRQRRPIKRPGQPRTEAKQETDLQVTVIAVLQKGFEYAGHLLFHLLDIIGIAFKTMKAPLGWIIAGYILVGIAVMTTNLARQSFYAALSPICRIPGSSLLNLPFCDETAVAKYGNEPPAPEFERLMQSQARFEDILASSSVGVSLPADMKRFRSCHSRSAHIGPLQFVEVEERTRV